LYSLKDNSQILAGKTLLVITGPTASGKTALSIRLAQRLQTEIISADSRQFYKELHIGTAKPTAEELAAAPHHFIGHKSVAETYSAGDFEKDALALIEKLFKKQNVVILTGGSGLYIDAVCKGLDILPEINPEIRAGIIKAYREKGISWLQAELRLKDPGYLEMADQQNPQRLMRALEVHEATGLPFSGMRKNLAGNRPFKILTIGLQWDRPMLYDRINKRVDDMIRLGLEEEALQHIAFKEYYALKTVGYAEFFDFFAGKYGREEAIELIKQHTRNFAKRQITWFKRNTETIWLDATSNENEIFALLKKNRLHDI
jgi:tRNA dimethylallyltransferase